MAMNTSETVNKGELEPSGDLTLAYPCRDMLHRSTRSTLATDTGFVGTRMYLKLDQEGPLHAQLTRALRTAILDGRLKAGTRLASTRSLATDLGLSRTTIIAAFEQLRAEGFITGKVGSGTYVNAIERVAVKHPPKTHVEPQSRYTRRLRKYMHTPILPRYGKLRYVMQYGVPLINPVLTSAWSRELAKAARYASPAYPNWQGMPELREAVADYLGRRRGVLIDADRVLVVNGTQQALTLCARVLLDEGNFVVIEEPHYFGAHRVLGSHGAKLVPVRTDREGIVSDELPNSPPRMIFVTPSHQFPGGSIMSLTRRLDLLRYAHEHGCWIVEDDYDSEFRYDVKPLPALRSIDEHDQVIYIGTFSKALLSSLRLGYMVLPSVLIKDFIHAKWLDDMGSPVIEQIALANFMRNGGFERHLNRASKMIKARRKTLIKGLRTHAGEYVDIEDSHAGMHLVVWLPKFDYEQCHALIEHACNRGLGLFPIEPHYVTPPPRPGLLLGYAGLSVNELREATELFGQCIRELDKPGNRQFNRKR